MRIGIIGGSGYAGGELLRLLIPHPEVEIALVTSRRFAGEHVYMIHPNLRGRTALRFAPLNPSELAEGCDLVFSAAPHGSSMGLAPALLEQGVKVIDVSADFRLRDPDDYPRWYGWKHSRPELLGRAVPGIPELHRDEIGKADLVACPGCMAVSSILALAPAVKAGFIDTERIVIDVKIGSSGGGSEPTLASHHPERFGGVRPYQVVGHRHTAEIEQELGSIRGGEVKVAFTPHAVNAARGILATCHVWLTRQVEERDVWKAYRGMYDGEPFIRIVKYRKGLYQLPDPKVVLGTNFCDIGFEMDGHVERLVVLSAIDNIVKGAAGQAVQCFNVMLGLDERTGLDLIGIH
ncbi:N-acetyl-gamma-glutamyl-phosphate reductase [miscellaneous Crenarchaeota group-15 archaeon DG-45]|uniref:Putative [LysW]-L-2-aminoadipate/[LysW]-L-glutamate phosphate reductase n=1 Tax=miscellaneous Crenarchaeota group-15 archaeon DG-45 TaxID=1685127 RepID=A0A0M0BL11_9ARCH|nr:MAG: N-acetyl-gamma-glutamyl-phosphate reductase [miscellaneous Crenarchaeota group-15 archaeon DG-45]